MTVIETSDPSDGLVQQAIANSNIGGGRNLSAQFSVPADTAWAVVGTVLSASVTAALIESNIKPALTALAQITSVNGDQLKGKTETSLLLPNTQSKLYVTSDVRQTIGAGGFENRSQSSKSITIPDDTKWAVFIMRLPAELTTAAMVTALQNAMKTVTGINNAVHLIDGYVPARATAAAILRIHAHGRIELVPE